MIVNCSNCDTKYDVDPAKVVADVVKFRCKECSSYIVVQKNDIVDQDSSFDLSPSTGFTPFADDITQASEDSEDIDSFSDDTDFGALDTEFDTKDTEFDSEDTDFGSFDSEFSVDDPSYAAEDIGRATEDIDKKFDAPLTDGGTKTKGFGIRFKMFAFLLVLIIVFAVQAVYLIFQLTRIADKFGAQGTEIVKEMAEKDIMGTAKAVANQVRLYLDAHPDLKKENFLNDHQFRKIVIQQVGKTGYTALYEKGDDGKWRTWAHIRPNICAPKLDDMYKLKGPMGNNFAGFWSIYSGVTATKPSKGYYKWQEKDKSFKDKYMACVSIQGTSFFIASTTYIDEFTEPMQRLKENGKAIAKKESTRNGIIVLVIALFVSLAVFIFGGRLSNNIKYLSDVTDRISLGELDALIEIKSKDELATLTESISRLQQSVRLSMQRLRR